MYIEQDDIPMALLLLQYGDLGMILGIHAKSLGCKLSPSGLYWLQSIGGVEKKYAICDEPQMICKGYFNLDYHKWLGSSPTVLNYHN